MISDEIIYPTFFLNLMRYIHPMDLPIKKKIYIPWILNSFLSSIFFIFLMALGIFFIFKNIEYGYAIYFPFYFSFLLQIKHEHIITSLIGYNELEYRFYPI